MLCARLRLCQLNPGKTTGQYEFASRVVQARSSRIWLVMMRRAWSGSPVSADAPGRNDGGLSAKIVERGVIDGVAFECAPPVRDAEQDGPAADVRIVIEDVERAIDVIECVLTTVVETGAPDADDGTTVVVQVELVVSDVVFVDHAAQIGDEQLLDFAGAESGEVIHQAPWDFGLGARGTDVVHDLIAEATQAIMSGCGDEALEDGAADIVVVHPLEVSVHGLRVGGAEDFGDGSVVVAERGGVALVVVESGEVGPVVDGAASGLEAAARAVVVEADVCGRRPARRTSPGNR